MRKAFWQGRRVFLTGHTGFKGSWLALWLHELGAETTGFALEPPSDPSLFEMANVAGTMTSIHGDVRDLEVLQSAMARSEPEVVLHLAAQSLVREGYDDPITTYSTNVLGTAHVLEACRHVESVRAVVSVTTDKCYENLESLRAFREGDPLGGKDPYSSSKACAEHVTAAYRQSYFESGDRPVGVASARAGNVIGGGDWARDRLVPDLIRGFIVNQPVPIRSPLAIRPWQHVLDPLKGYLDLAERAWAEPGAVGGGWNFGPDATDERAVEWVADRLVERWGDRASWDRDAGAHPAEAAFLKLDSSKARDHLGWWPQLRLEQALGWVVEWHRSVLDGASAAEITRRQIRDYQALDGLDAQTTPHGSDSPDD